MFGFFNKVEDEVDSEVIVENRRKIKNRKIGNLKDVEEDEYTQWMLDNTNDKD